MAPVDIYLASNEAAQRIVAIEWNEEQGKRVGKE
jgi:hypothetical protein